MDEQLQQLRREAALSGDYSSYERALLRTGRKRLVFRRLTVIRFPAADQEPRVSITNWSSTPDFAVANGHNFYVDSLDRLVTGKFIPNHLDTVATLRILDIEIKELVVPVEYLERPSRVEADKPKLPSTGCYDENPCYRHGCVPCLNRGSTHPDTFPCSNCDGQLRLKWDTEDHWDYAWLWRDSSSPDDTCTCDHCYHPGYANDWRMRFCDDCGGNVAGLRHANHCTVYPQMGSLPTDLKDIG